MCTCNILNYIQKAPATNIDSSRVDHMIQKIKANNIKLVLH